MNGDASIKSTASTPAASSKRRWWRLHLSTVILAAPVVAFLVALIVPGARTPGWAFSRGNLIYGDFEFGWPWPYARREVFEASSFYALYSGLPWPEEREPAPWMDSASWPRLDSSITFESRGLVFDGLCFVAALVVWLIVLETRRRRRHSFWQLSLKETLAATAAIAVGMAWVGHAKQGYDRELLALRTLFENCDKQALDKGALAPSPPPHQSCGYSQEFQGPEWLARLLPPRARTWFLRARRVTASLPEDARRKKQAVDQLLLLDCTSEVDISGNSLNDDDLGKVAVALPLHLLMVRDSTEITASGWKALGDAPQLEHLHLADVPLDREEVNVLLDVGIEKITYYGRLVDRVAMDMARSPRFFSVSLSKDAGFSLELRGLLASLEPDVSVEYGGQTLSWRRGPYGNPVR